MCVCVYHCAHLSYTIQHKTEPIIFPPNQQRIITAIDCRGGRTFFKLTDLQTLEIDKMDFKVK